jgi:hypothetical protein
VRRHPALVPLSEEHQHELAHARRLLGAAGAGPQQRLAVASAYLDAFFTETVEHFRREEEILFPLSVRQAGSTPVLERILREHMELHGLVRALRAGAAAGEITPEALRTLGDLLHERAPGGARAVRADRAHRAGGGTRAGEALSRGSGAIACHPKARPVRSRPRAGRPASSVKAWRGCGRTSRARPGGACARPRSRGSPRRPSTPCRGCARSARPGAACAGARPGDRHGPTALGGTTRCGVSRPAKPRNPVLEPACKSACFQPPQQFRPSACRELLEPRQSSRNRDRARLRKSAGDRSVGTDRRRRGRRGLERARAGLGLWRGLIGCGFFGGWLGRAALVRDAQSGRP